MGVGSSPGATSGERSSLPESRDGVGDQIVDAALELFARQGYDTTTVDQIAAKAGVSPADFAQYFATAEAVLMSIVDDIAHVTATELRGVPKGVEPERALLQAGTAALSAVVEGRSHASLDRVLAMARTVTATRNLQRKVSAARKRVLTQPLADWMEVDPNDRRLQHALTMWSAVTASAYVGALDLPDRYEPERDGELQQRIIAGVLQSFTDVMGVDPKHPE